MRESQWCLRTPAMSVMGQERTSAALDFMSAFPPITDINSSNARYWVTDLRKAITLSRSVFLGNPTNGIMVKGMNFSGFSRNRSSVSSLQTTPDFFISSEWRLSKLEARCPAVAPNRPNRLGPTLSGPPSSTEWHSQQTALKVSLPAVTLPSAWPGVAPAVKARDIANVARIYFTRFSTDWSCPWPRRLGQASTIIGDPTCIMGQNIP